MSLESIIKYKDHQIVLVRNDLSSFGKYVCGYVYLDNIEILEKNIGQETYRKGNVIGVDTAHSYIDNMTYEEKREDAIRGVKEIIDIYETVNKK